MFDSYQSVSVPIRQEMKLQSDDDSVKGLCRSPAVLTHAVMTLDAFLTFLHMFLIT